MMSWYELIEDRINWLQKAPKIVWMDHETGKSVPLRMHCAGRNRGVRQ